MATAKPSVLAQPVIVSSINPAAMERFHQRLVPQPLSAAHRTVAGGRATAARHRLQSLVDLACGSDLLQFSGQVGRHGLRSSSVQKGVPLARANALRSSMLSRVTVVIVFLSAQLGDELPGRALQGRGATLAAASAAVREPVTELADGGDDHVR